MADDAATKPHVLIVGAGISGVPLVQGLKLSQENVTIRVEENWLSMVVNYAYSGPDVDFTYPSAVSFCQLLNGSKAMIPQTRIRLLHTTGFLSHVFPSPHR